jgi:UDP-N-acetylglucosamine 2-epimerase
LFLKVYKFFIIFLENGIEALVKALVYLVKDNKNISVIYRVTGHSNIKELKKKFITSELKNNIFITTKFLPQKYILNDKHIKAVITHGGTNTIIESIYNNLPLLCLPIGANHGIN